MHQKNDSKSLNGQNEKQLTPEEHAKQTRSWQAGDEALVKLSTAMRMAKEAKTIRELARARVAIQETLIRSMVADGAPWAFVLEHLEKAMPEIPRNDLFRALEALRNRMLRERQKIEGHPIGQESNLKTAPKDSRSEPLRDPHTVDFINGKADSTDQKRAAQAQTNSELKDARQESVANSIDPKDDGSDRQPGESDADYQLRKSLEPDPKGRQKFIGEH